MSDSKKTGKRTEERRLVKTAVAFNTENDIYIARSVDISGRGIRLATETPIDICIQIKVDDELVKYHAKLVWARLKDDGSMEYGLKYLAESTK
jgi:hypothetical protein